MFVEMGSWKRMRNVMVTLSMAALATPAAGGRNAETELSILMKNVMTAPVTAIMEDVRWIAGTYW
jgi:hypothetical protein